MVRVAGLLRVVKRLVVHSGAAIIRATAPQVASIARCIAGAAVGASIVERLPLKHRREAEHVQRQRRDGRSDADQFEIADGIERRREDGQVARRGVHCGDDWCSDEQLLEPPGLGGVAGRLDESGGGAAVVQRALEELHAYDAEDEEDEGAERDDVAELGHRGHDG